VRLSYHVAAALHIHPRERQQLIELDDVAERLERELVPSGLWALVEPLTDRDLTQSRAADDGP
jgi:hypothetical protein